MSKEKRRVPKLRFPGFAEDWEQRKFGDLFEYERPDAYIVKSDNYNDDFNMPVLTANKAFILGYTNEENSYNKPSIIFDDFTLDRKYVDFPYMLKSSAIKILTSKNQHNLRFLFERLNSTRFEVLGHARHYISVVQNTTTLCPSVDEEVCISNLLTKFDELITLHQRKLNNLKLKKKALLQKLFPKNGERYPELRFPGFTDAWEQRKLNDFVTIRRGLTYKPSDIVENGIRVLRSSNIDEDQFITSNDDVFVNIEAVNIPFTKNGDILITSANGSNRLVGKHTIISDIAENSAVHGGFMLLAESNNPLFTDALLSSNWYKKFINTYVAGGNGAIGNLSKSDLERQTVMVPSGHEQAKIGQWYFNINQLITLHQRKLEHLQLQKKALLQQMFV